MKTPRNYQLDAKQYLWKWFHKGFGGCLFMQMRLGKTYTMILFAIEACFEKVLVVAPANVLKVWEEELHTEGVFNVMCLEGTKANKEHQLAKATGWVLVSYHMAEKLDMHMYEWDAMILDESLHIAAPPRKCIKNPKTGKYVKRNNWSAYFTQNFYHVKYRYVLCGAPMPEEELQYFNQVAFCFNQMMGYGSFWSFKNDNYTKLMYEDLPLPGVREKIKKFVDINTFQLTRSQANIGEKQVYSRRYVEMTPKQRKLYESMETLMATEYHETSFAGAQYQHLRKIANGFDIDNKVFVSNEKIKVIKDLLKGELKKVPVLIWASLVTSPNEVEFILKSIKEKAIYITGKECGTCDTKGNLTPLKFTLDNKEKLRKLYQNGTYKRAVFSFAMRKGIRLDAADVAIYFSNMPSGDAREQSKDRIIGSEQGTKLIIDLLTRNTVDEDMYHLLQDKSINQKFFMSNAFGMIQKRVANKAEQKKLR